MATKKGIHVETSPLLTPRSDINEHQNEGGVLQSDNSRIDGDVIRQATDIERPYLEGATRHARPALDTDFKRQLIFILPSVGIGVFLAAADQTIIASSYGRIGSDLNALNLTSWIATSYFLTLTSFQPLYGKLSDIFGRKSCLLFSYLIFGTGCLFCGLAQDIYQLIAARIWQGIGGGGMTTVVTILLSDIVPLQDRGLWQGFLNLIFTAGAATGAPLGGLLSDSIGWRWAFLGQAPLCLLAFITVFFFLKPPSQKQEASERKNGLKRIDFLGAFVLVLAVSGLLVGLDRGSNASWTLPIAYGPLLASVILFALFVLVETRFASEPFAPGHIIFERSLLAAYLCNFFSFGAYMSILYFLPLFYQAAEGLTATRASILMIPFIVFAVIGSLTGGFAMRLTGKYYWCNLIGYTLLPTGCLLVFLFTGPIATLTIGIVLGQVLCAFGNGVGVTTSLIALISNAAPEDQAVTTACSYLFRSLGSVIGISLTTTAIQQALRSILRQALNRGSRNGDIDAIVNGVRRSLDYLQELDPGTRSVVRTSYGEAITCYGFALTAGFAVCATISSIFVKEKSLNR